MADLVESTIGIETLSNAEVLTLSDHQLPPDQDARLSALLDQEQADHLTAAERAELAGLLHAYRLGLLRKAPSLVGSGSPGLVSTN